MDSPPEDHSKDHLISHSTTPTPNPGSNFGHHSFHFVSSATGTGLQIINITSQGM